MKRYLSKSELKHVLAKHYGIITTKIKKIGYSFTDCYIIYGPIKYFVKVFNKDEDILKIKHENELLIILRESGFKVPSIVKTKEGDIYVNIANHYLFLEKYIEGFSYAEEKISPNILIKSAKILGKLHYALNGRFDDSNKEAYWKNLDMEKEMQHLNSLLEIFKKFPQDSSNDIIIKSINHKMRMLPELKKISNKFNGITYLMAHGDYSKRNLLQDNSNNLYIVDFSDAGVYPAAWELIRSYFISTDSCKHDDLFNYDLFSQYISAYFEEFSLNKKDIELMPYLFLYQILTSNYRYQEYLITKDEKYLKFIEWKENMSCFLEKYSKKIVGVALTSIEKKNQK